MKPLRIFPVEECTRFMHKPCSPPFAINYILECLRYSYSCLRGTEKILQKKTGRNRICGDELLILHYI